MTEQINKDGTVQDVDIKRQEVDQRRGVIDPPVRHIDEPEATNPEGKPPEQVDPREVAKTNADLKRKQFDVEQKGRQAKFERDQTANERRLERQNEIKIAEAEEAERIRLLNDENDQKAYADGLLTDDDLRQHREYLAPHHDCVMPHQALGPKEATVKMAFPRTVILTRSVADLQQSNKAVRDRDSDTTVDERELIGNRGFAMSPIMPVTPGTRVMFRKGYQDVPVSLADHGYLYDNGAYRLDNDGKPESEDAREERMSKEQHDEDRAVVNSSEGSNESSAQVRRTPERRVEV